MRCNKCNGECEEIGGGKYRCLYCGEISSVDETATAKNFVTPKSDSGANVFENNISGILEIRWKDEKFIHSGSGFLISDDGYAITNTHVVTHEDGKSCGQVSVKMNNQNLTASVCALGDDKHGSGNGVDLALVKLSRVPAGSKVMEFEDFNNVRIGEEVFVVGNSLGYGTCITSGIVSDKARMVNGKTLLMTDCAVNGGNSGGPIFNEKGRVIGAIVSGIDNAEGMNFAIPANVIERFINDRLYGTKNKDGVFRLPPTQYTSCPKCGEIAIKYPNGSNVCTKCHYRWSAIKS